MCFAGRPGPCAPLASFLPWMIPDPGRCGYQDLVQPLATTITCCLPRRMSSLLLSIFPLLFYSLLILSYSCTDAHARQQAVRSLTECHDSRVVHHCGIARITRRRFHVRLEPVQTSTTAATWYTPFQTRCSNTLDQLSRTRPCKSSGEIVRTFYSVTVAGNVRPNFRSRSPLTFHSWDRPDR